VKFVLGLAVGFLVGLPSASAAYEPVPCMGQAMAISKRPNGDLYLTKRQSQSHVYIALLDRDCVHGRDDYRWPGYKKP
jgi:hypothetical protein